jgi:uncharacterized protein
VQFNRETSAGNLIRAWETGRVRIGERWHTGHLIVSAERIIDPWTVASPATVTIGDLVPAIELSPEIILLGTGSELLLPDVDLMGSLAAQAIGLEIMSTPAACRTFNVLLHERRHVVAAIFNFP